MLLDKIKNNPEQIEFDEVMGFIDDNYDFVETAFRNGNTENAAGENNGSCKIFAFAQLQNLTEEQTLHLFGDYYRKDVLRNQEGTDHQNIRNFIKHGWSGIDLSGKALAKNNN